ncbi:MAG TPA: AIM24 family protein, partial [Candidatus Baltobacteraceae bacterium]|nr:AIM24 family protein [Candidatus Baltobacteraceae bacterium]
MNCPTCQFAVPDGAKFCPNCGAPITAPASVNGYTEPQPETDNPKTPITLGDLTIRVEGELVPAVDVELGNQQIVYFEHHILLWKQPNVTLGFMNLQNAAKRFFAGLQIFISTAQGPGNIAFSREAPGQIVAMRLKPGQAIDVREHQFLLATGNVDYNFYWQQGLANVIFARTGLFIDRFTATSSEGLLLLHGYGNVFEKTLAAGEMLDVEPGAWLWKDANVRMDTVSVLNSSGRGGGLMGALGAFVGGAALMLNRFYGPGRVGMQSMTYHEPQAEGAQQTGGTSNIGNVLNSFLNPRQ